MITAFWVQSPELLFYDPIILTITFNLILVVLCTFTKKFILEQFKDLKLDPILQIISSLDFCMTATVYWLELRKMHSKCIKIFHKIPAGNLIKIKNLHFITQIPNVYVKN